MEDTIHELPWLRDQLGYRQGRSLVLEARGGWFPLEKRLFLGLPNTIEWDEDDPSWLYHELWDYLVYLQSLTHCPGYPEAAFYVNPKNANIHAGVNGRGVAGPLTRGDRVARVESLLPRLAQLGFIKYLGEYRRDQWPVSLPVHQHMLMPTWTDQGFIPSNIPRTPANLEGKGRPYAMIPRHVMRAKDGIFVRLERHALRRVFLALYAFNDLPRYGGVDPNHLRVEQTGEQATLLASDAFLAAAGVGPEDIKALLNEVVIRMNKRLPVACLPEVYVTSELTSDGKHRYRYVADCAAYNEYETSAGRIAFDNTVSRMMAMARLPHLQPHRIRVFRPVHQTSHQARQFLDRLQGRVNGSTE